VIEASAEAQNLALTAIHMGLDPYELWNRGLQELPPHPRPREYRALLYAMAHWYEERLTKRAEALPGMFATKLGLVKERPGPDRRRGRGGQPPRRRPTPRLPRG
jgi:hypothetical protein